MTAPKSTVAALSGLLLMLGLVGCTRSSNGASAGRLIVEGQAEVIRPGEERREVSGSRALEVGDRVRVRQGFAVIRLPDDRQLELRQGTDVELQGPVSGSGVRPTLMNGDLLVLADGEALGVEAANAQVAVQGDARISKGVTVLVAVYEGTAQLSSGDSALTVPALRQAAVPAAGPFPTRPSPLEFSPADAWDQRYLSDTIELSNQLAARSQGFSAQLGPTEGRSYNYFRELFPRLASEPGFTASLPNPARLPGETLVGAAITLEGTRGTFAERWAAVFGFRDQGAPWGLVALDQGVRKVQVLATIDDAAGRSPTQFAEGSPAGGSGSGTSSGGGGPSVTPTTVAPRATTTTIPRRPAASPTTTTAPSTTPTSTIPGGPINTGSPIIDETVNSLVDTLTGLLRSLGGP